MRAEELKRIVDGNVTLEEREAFVAQLTAELPEARVIRRAIDAHSARVLTFELLSSEEPR